MYLRHSARVVRKVNGANSSRLPDLYLWMIWSYAKPDQAKGYRKLLIHVDARPWYLTHHLLGRVEAGWSRSDDSNCRPSSGVNIARPSCMTEALSANMESGEYRGIGKRISSFTNYMAQASVDQHGHKRRTVAIILLTHKRVYFSKAQSRLETA